MFEKEVLRKILGPSMKDEVILPKKELRGVRKPSTAVNTSKPKFI
jgi:hypothetical protein